MGIARGAVKGAAAGSVFGPWGTAIGGVAGGIGGFLKGRGEDKAEDEDFRARSEQFGQDERSRIWRNQASQALLRSLFVVPAEDLHDWPRRSGSAGSESCRVG